MAAPETGGGRPSIRTLWAIAKSPRLSLTDEDLHAVVYRETGKESMRKLTQGEITSLVRILQNMKDKARHGSRNRRTDQGGNPRTVQQRRKIYVLCGELGWNDDPRRIHGFVRRITGVDRLEWLGPAQCEAVIEGLKAMVKRKEDRKA